jgi:hypothetical protein
LLPSGVLSIISTIITKITYTGGFDTGTSKIVQFPTRKPIRRFGRRLPDMLKRNRND